jgi:hypothetical protein
MLGRTPAQAFTDGLPPTPADEDHATRPNPKKAA